MSDHTRFKIEIYYDGVVHTISMRGKRHYLLAKAILDELEGNPHPPHAGARPIPDPNTDVYMLSRDQIAVYGAFRRNLKKFEAAMAIREAQSHSAGEGDSAVPRAFRSFCFSLAIGMKYAGPTPERSVRYAAGTLSREVCEGALRFLDRIAHNNYDADAVHEFWRGCASDLGFIIEGDIRQFFLSVRAETTKIVKPTVSRRHTKN